MCARWLFSTSRGARWSAAAPRGNAFRFGSAGDQLLRKALQGLTASAQGNAAAVAPRTGTKAQRSCCACSAHRHMRAIYTAVYTVPEPLLCCQTGVPSSRVEHETLGLMSQSQPFAVLLPLSQEARNFRGLYGSRLFLRDGIVLGRAPASKNSATLGSNWLQVSSNHANFQWDSAQVRHGPGPVARSAYCSM